MALGCFGVSSGEKIADTWVVFAVFLAAMTFVIFMGDPASP